MHLDDLSGVLELAVLAALWFALGRLKKRELSLAHFAHGLLMAVLIGVAGHFLEEHVIGLPRLEAFLKYGFSALGVIFFVVDRPPE